MRLKETPKGLLDQEAYAIYAQCMYRPTRSAYEQTAHSLIQEGVRFFSCVTDEGLSGLIALNRFDDACAEIVGIAVRQDQKKKGIGRFMVRQAAAQMKLRHIKAETDADAVGFYRHIGFDPAPFFRDYPNGSVLRYQCNLWLE